jgi:hypothetical protein
MQSVFDSGAISCPSLFPPPLTNHVSSPLQGRVRLGRRGFHWLFFLLWEKLGYLV